MMLQRRVSFSLADDIKRSGIPHSQWKNTEHFVAWFDVSFLLFKHWREKHGHSVHNTHLSQKSMAISKPNRYRSFPFAYVVICHHSLLSDQSISLPRKKELLVCSGISIGVGIQVLDSMYNLQSQVACRCSLLWLPTLYSWFLEGLIYCCKAS